MQFTRGLKSGRIVMRKALVDDVVEVIALVDGFFTKVFFEFFLIFPFEFHRILNPKLFYQHSEINFFFIDLQ